MNDWMIDVYFYGWMIEYVLGWGLPRGPVLPDGPLQVYGGRQGEVVCPGWPPRRDHAEHHVKLQVRVHNQFMA